MSVNPDSGTRRTLVFVRYGPAHDPNLSLVRNVADPLHAPCLTAHDLGVMEDARVAAGYPDRTPYIWDEATQKLVPVS